MKVGFEGLLEICITRYFLLIDKVRRSEKFQWINQKIVRPMLSDRGDVPGWVLVVLMTTGLVTAIWTIAAPRLTSILKNSLDAMNGIR